MRGRHLVWTVGIVLILGTPAAHAQRTHTQPKPIAAWQLAQVVNHRLPGKSYRSDVAIHPTLQMTTPSSVAQQMSSPTATSLPSIAFLFAPKNRAASDNENLVSDDDVLPGYEHLRDIQATSSRPSETSRPDTRAQHWSPGSTINNPSWSSPVDGADSVLPSAPPSDTRSNSSAASVNPIPIPSADKLIENDDVLPGYEHLLPNSGRQQNEVTPIDDMTPDDGYTLPTGEDNPSQPVQPPLDNENMDEVSNENGDPDDGEPGDDDKSQVDPHLELLSKNMYPSAKECGKCHEDHYREWSVSSHAYASISPMFQKFEQTINDLSQGTIGYFCMRCHAPVATAICDSRDESLWHSIPAANEGVTCIACHRVIERYFKVNGERRIETGSLFEPVVASSNQNKLHEIIAKKDHYKVKTSPDDKGPGQAIHNDVICFEQLSSSHFCVSCHQVSVFPGIKLEIVWDQYRASPACKEGISCQDCHMGAVPGRAEGYATGPTAIVGGKKISPDRKHANHMFYGPGYSIAHPGTFPINPKADDWNVDEWLDFDWRAGWGTKEFEDRLHAKEIHATFPEAWQESDDRMDARDVIDENLKLIGEKRDSRFELMEGSSKLEGPFFANAPRAGKPLKFQYRVKNLNSGHNMPSGSLGAQPQVWLNVVLTGPCGERIWESGYVDANGDVADLHSLEVAAGRIRRDQQLFNLQTRFLTTHVKGTDREMYLPINLDIDQLAFLRPSGLPVTSLNHPPFIRLENHSLPPLGERMAKYRVPAKLIQQPGRYRLSVRMRSRAEPIYFMRFCKATPEMERTMNERMLDFHQHAYEFIVR